MKKRYEKIVGTCLLCPAKNLVDYIGVPAIYGPFYVCYRHQPPKIICRVDDERVHTIPDWCPLADAEVNE